jgi:organic hydroperoxide reductase OsmC/OhrA
MRDEFDYQLGVTRRGNLGSGTSTTRAFSREVVIEREGKAPLLVSADHRFHGDPSLLNPEELLLASLATCHMLSYFYVAVREGFSVVDYHDEPTAGLKLNRDGRGAITRAELRPRVTVASEAMINQAVTAHDEASKLCFIRNSVNFPVTIEPQVAVAAV